MLDTLSKFSQGEVLGVLSKLATQVAPEPLLEEERVASHAVDFQNSNVLTEIRDRLGLSQNDRSDEARDKIINFISDRISEIVLGKADEKEIKTRLAERSLLRPDLYEITFHKKSARALQRGIRRDHIRQALNYPDDAEHVQLDNEIFKDQGSASFYVKHYIDANDATKNFSLLVISNRKGYKQIVADAIRVYPTDIDVANVSHPLDLLKAFVHKYGSFIEVFGRKEKLFLLTRLDKPKIIHDDPPVKVEQLDGTSPSLLIVYADMLTAIDIVIAYAIDENSYRADLKRHGVHLN